MKNFKKVLAFVLAIAMMAVFCACTPSQPQTAQSGSENADTNSAVSEFTDGEAVMPAISKEDLKIGVIHITDPAEGTGYTYTHDLGIQGMQKNIGLSDDQIVRKNNVSDTDPTAIEAAIRDCVSDGCNVIFATSYGFMDTCEMLADEYPNVIFSHGTGYKSNGKNFNNYFGRIYQARYLAGIAAGMKTKSNKIGYVAAMDKANPEVTGGLDAFAMGIESVNPDAKVYVKVTNSWFDPAGEQAAAQALIDMGCDVIGQHCDTAGPQTTAEAAGVWGVGYNSDMSKQAPKAVLTSVMWDWQVYYTAAVQAIIDGKWTGKNYFAGMQEGLVNISDLSDVCEEGTKEKIDAAREKIMSGEWDVFTGEIIDNEGNTVCAAGEKLDDATITGKINWYYRNIVE